MTDLTNLLADIRKQSDGLTDLCPEHLRQGIRHLYRNCDIECNTHHDESDWTTWGDCKHPDRYDGARMAEALASIPRLLAALEGVVALHQPVEVYEYDDIPGVFKLDADGEQVLMAMYCRECTPDYALELIGDCEYDPTDDCGEVSYPCPSVAAVVAALGEGL